MPPTHSTPGNALNYEERYKRVKAFLEKDVVNAYQRVLCIGKAANAFYNLGVTLDSPSNQGYLDKLVIFLRDVIDKLEIEALKKEVDSRTALVAHAMRMTCPKSLI